MRHSARRRAAVAYMSSASRLRDRWLATLLSVGGLAALSDNRCAEIRKTPNEAEKGASVLGLRDKARRALGGAWET